MERLSWMYDKYHMNESKAQRVLNIRREMLKDIRFERELFIILYEEPEGSPRPRARFVNKTNLVSSAKAYPGHIQIYSLTGKSDRMFMKRMINDNDLLEVNSLIHTACSVDYEVYIKTPSQFNNTDTYLAELGYIRPLCKPDFDNIEKKYSDMYNGNVWLDDSLVVDGTIKKFYSILPRVEIRLRYLNMLYNKYQYNSISKRVEDPETVVYFDSSKIR